MARVPIADQIECAKRLLANEREQTPVDAGAVAAIEGIVASLEWLARNREVAVVAHQIVTAFPGARLTITAKG